MQKCKIRILYKNSTFLSNLKSIKFKRESTIGPGAGTKKICRSSHLYAVHTYTRDERVTREEVGEELLQRRVSKRDGKERKEEEE